MTRGLEKTSIFSKPPPPCGGASHQVARGMEVATLSWWYKVLIIEGAAKEGSPAASLNYPPIHIQLPPSARQL